MVVAALTAAAAVLLAVAGLAKLRTPGPAASMIVGFAPGRVSLRHGRLLARVAGGIEAITALAVLAVGGRIAAVALVACYLVLSAVAVRLAFGPQRAPCGCFGAADGEVGIAHVVLDGCGLAIAVTALVTAPGGLVALFDSGVLVGVTACLQAALLAGLGYLSITALPALMAERTPLEGR